MIRNIVICAVIALILVPAGVMAAGFGGQNTGTVSGQGQCLNNCQNCTDQSAAPGLGNQTQHKYGAQFNGNTGLKGSANGQNCTDQPGAPGLGNQTQHKYGAQLNGNTGLKGSANGQNCTDQSGAPGLGNQTQHKYGAQFNGNTGLKGSANGQCNHEQEQTRSMQRLQDGSCPGCKNVPVTQP